MGSLKEVRNRIISVKNTQQITRAMKVVSAAKLRKAQQRIQQMRPYAVKLHGLIANLSNSSEGEEAAKFFAQRPANRVLMVVITSDRGLAGSFNASLIKEAIRHSQEAYGELVASQGVEIAAIGKKGRDFFRKSKYGVVHENTTIFGSLTWEEAVGIGNYLIAEFLSGKYDRISLVYNQFKNAAVYLPTVEQFLPVVASEDGGKAAPTDYIFEPNQEELIGKLIPQSLKVSLYKALLDSNASEHGARMTAMEKATENAEDLIRELKLQYNKERQASITKEILEIVSGAQALG